MTTAAPTALTCTGSVLAVADIATAVEFWTGPMGFEPAIHPVDGSGESSFEHPTTGQRVTLIELPSADPAMAMAVRVGDLDAGLAQLSASGFVEHWSDTSRDDITFRMCRNDTGVFILLYRTSSM